MCGLAAASPNNACMARDGMGASYRMRVSGLGVGSGMSRKAHVLFPIQVEKLAGSDHRKLANDLQTFLFGFDMHD